MVRNKLFCIIVVECIGATDRYCEGVSLDSLNGKEIESFIL